MLDFVSLFPWKPKCKHIEKDKKTPSIFYRKRKKNPSISTVLAQMWGSIFQGKMLYPYIKNPFQGTPEIKLLKLADCSRFDLEMTL